MKKSIEVYKLIFRICYEQLVKEHKTEIDYTESLKVMEDMRKKTGQGKPGTLAWEMSEAVYNEIGRRHK